jgi:hypothetical protein
MNRREFFKFPAVVALIAAVPVLAKAEVEPVKQNCTGWIREIMAYDIERDAFILRHDLSDGRIQRGVDYEISGYEGLEKEQFLIEKRMESIKKLEEYAIKEGMNLNKLVKLKLPSGVEHGRYV